jgi:hypothetical protein
VPEVDPQRETQGLLVEGLTKRVAIGHLPSRSDMVQRLEIRFLSILFPLRFASETNCGRGARAVERAGWGSHSDAGDRKLRLLGAHPQQLRGVYYAWYTER